MNLHVQELALGRYGFFFFWTKYKIEVIPWVSCYYHFSKKRFINLHLIFFSFSSADSQVKELKKEFMKGKGVPNLVSDFSFRICFVMHSLFNNGILKQEAISKRYHLLIRQDQNWIITCFNKLYHIFHNISLHHALRVIWKREFLSAWKINACDTLTL